MTKELLAPICIDDGKTYKPGDKWKGSTDFQYTCTEDATITVTGNKKLLANYIKSPFLFSLRYTNRRHDTCWAIKSYTESLSPMHQR